MFHPNIQNKLKFLAEIVLCQQNSQDLSDQKIVLFNLPEHNLHYPLNDLKLAVNKYLLKWNEFNTEFV